MPVLHREGSLSCDGSWFCTKNGGSDVEVLSSPEYSFTPSTKPHYFQLSNIISLAISASEEIRSLHKPPGVGLGLRFGQNLRSISVQKQLTANVRVAVAHSVSLWRQLACRTSSTAATRGPTDPSRASRTTLNDCFLHPRMVKTGRPQKDT